MDADLRRHDDVAVEHLFPSESLAAWRATEPSCRRRPPTRRSAAHWSRTTARRDRGRLVLQSESLKPSLRAVWITSPENHDGASASVLPLTTQQEVETRWTPIRRDARGECARTTVGLDMRHCRFGLSLRVSLLTLVNLRFPFFLAPGGAGTGLATKYELGVPRRHDTVVRVRSLWWHTSSGREGSHASPGHRRRGVVLSMWPSVETIKQISSLSGSHRKFVACCGDL